jgi:hypothetical protein
MSHTEIATRCPGATHSRRGFAPVGFRSVSRSRSIGSANPARWLGSITVVRASGTSISSPLVP